MSNLNFILATMAGMSGGDFYFPSFYSMEIGATRITGKLPDLSWRDSKRAKSMSKRSNRRKAKRKAKGMKNNA